MSYDDEWHDGGFEFHEAPCCPWCGSRRTWAEFGMYDACFPTQLSPYLCHDCGAMELWVESDSLVADNEERAMGWFKSPPFDPPTGIQTPADLWTPLSTTDFMNEAARFAGTPFEFRGEPL